MRALKQFCCVVLLWALGLTWPVFAQNTQPPTPSETTPRNALPKFALVIGNARYEGFNRQLKNPHRDAQLMSSSLTKLGFEVETYFDLSRTEMHQRISTFAASLPAGSTSLVFYAGHGLQIGGASYLMPVDIQLSGEHSVALRAFPLTHLLDAVSGAASAVNIVVLDACRDNPFQPPPPVRYRSAGPMGLAKVQTPRGTFLAYATQPGQLAQDGSEANSVYTAALAKTLLESGLSLEDIFKKVNTLVRNKTRDDQIPWYESSLTETYYFLPPDGIQVLSANQPAANAAARTGRKRAETPAAAQPPRLWYLGMSEYDWSMMDLNIEQRVRHLTADELPELTQLAEGGNVIAITTLARVYQDGMTKTTRVKTGEIYRSDANNTLARYWLEKGAEQDFPIAQTLLAEMHMTAMGGDRNLAQAQRLLQRAARANYPRAKLNLAQVELERRPVGAPLDQARWIDAMKSIMKSAQPAR